MDAQAHGAVRREVRYGLLFTTTTTASPRRPGVLALSLCVRALVYPRDDRVLVGRGIIVPRRRLVCIVASRHDSPSLCILSPPGFASFVHTFLLAFVVWCVRGGVCGGRVIFWGGRCSGPSTGPPPGPPFFQPRPKQQNGLGGRAILCWLDLESAASHFCPISGCSSLFSFFLFFYFIFENGRWRERKEKRE